jgi:hypothetical protein
MVIYDLGIAWEWPYDVDFIRLLEPACHENGLSLFQITPNNLDNILQSIANSEISFRALFDRASDTDKKFIPLVDWARSQPIYLINPYPFAQHAWDKVACHIDLTNAGLSTPKTFFLPSFKDEPCPTREDLGSLGSCFTIKPAHGGGGKGVVKQATTWDEVLVARQQYPDDQYLIQEFIEPAILDSRQAWFRVIYCCREVYLCWWDTTTHAYTPLLPTDEERLHLQPLREIAYQIARISNLDLFSSEIAETPQGEFIVVDYINDPVDLRLQSITNEGVPDDIVRTIAAKITLFVKTRKVLSELKDNHN